MLEVEIDKIAKVAAYKLGYNQVPWYTLTKITLYI